MDLAGVQAHSARLGPLAHLATSTAARGPHVAPIHVDWHEGRLWAMVGLRSARVRNVADSPAACLHYQVAAATGWDSLVIWGTADIHADIDTKRRIWAGVLSYDLDAFAPGGPDASPDTGLLAFSPTRAVLLREYGMAGREEWRAQ